MRIRCFAVCAAILGFVTMNNVFILKTSNISLAGNGSVSLGTQVAGSGSIFSKAKITGSGHVNSAIHTAGSGHIALGIQIAHSGIVLKNQG
jgi:hypothetical protein